MLSELQSVIVPQLSPTTSIVVLLVMLWTIPWKGVALWKSAKNGHKWWFIALLVVNTLAILEILYIFVFSKCCAPGKKQEKKAKRR